MARRSKVRLAGVVLPAAMFFTLTSFRPAARDDIIPPPPLTPESTPFIYEAPETPEPPRPPELPSPRWARHSRPDRGLADQLAASFPELAMVARMNAEIIAQRVNAEIRNRDERELREYVRELRYRLRAEARRIARDR
jgi:hypothetical protein